MMVCALPHGIMNLYYLRGPAQVAEHADDVETWLGINSYLDHPPNLQYTVCLYWTINTMLGERSSPQDQMSTLLSLFLSVAGIFMYFGYGSLLLAYVGTMTMTNADFEKKMWLRASYLRKLQVPARLTHVIRVLGSFLWYRPWHCHAGFGKAKKGLYRA